MAHSNSDYKQQVFQLAQAIVFDRLEKAGKPIPDDKAPVYVIYARKSTKGKKKNQDGKQVERQERSIPDQIKDCKALAKREGLKVVDILKEEKSARKSANREVFEEMIDEIKSKKSYNAIICWHPDRLGRNMKDAGEIIDLIDRGVIKDLKFPQFSFQRDPNGLMTLGLQFLLAKAYSDNLSINVSRGNENIIGEGKAIGNKALRGYKVVNKRQRPDGKNFKLIQQAFQMGIEGKSQDDIALYLNQNDYTQNGKKAKMSKQLVSAMFLDTSYTGYYVYGKNMVDLTKLDSLFTPAVSYLDYLRLRNILDGKKGYKKVQEKATPLLDQMVVCGYCGNLMTTYLNKNKPDSPTTYLRIKCSTKECYSHSVKGLREIRAKVIFEYIYEVLSSGIGINEKAYNHYVADAKRQLVSSAKELESDQRSISKQINDLESQIEEQQIIVARLEDDEKSVKVAREKIRQARDEIEQLETKLAQIKNQRVDTVSLLKEKVMSYTEFSNFFENIVATLETSDNHLATDSIIRMVFLNFTIKDKKVLTHQWNPKFESIAKIPSVNECRGDRTRTCGLTLPKRAL